MIWPRKFGRIPLCHKRDLRMHLALTSIIYTQRIIYGHNSNMPHYNWLLIYLYTRNTLTAIPFGVSFPPFSHSPWLITQLYALPPLPPLPLPLPPLPLPSPYLYLPPLHPMLMQPSFGSSYFPLLQLYSVVCGGLLVEFKVLIYLH